MTGCSIGYRCSPSFRGGVALVTISMRELSASKGYDYLLRSVAATSPSRAGGAEIFASAG